MDFASKIGIVLTVVGLGVAVLAIFAPYEWRNMPARVRRAGLVSGAVLVLLGLSLIFLIPSPGPPDISLRFVYPKQPLLEIINVSDEVARNIKYEFAIWNIDRPSDKNPLPILVSSFDFLRPHQAAGPEDVFDRFASMLSPGTRLFGSVGIECADCARGRTFWLYIAWGKGGSYSEIMGQTSGGVMVPKNMNTTDAAQFAVTVIASIPVVPEYLS